MKKSLNWLFDYPDLQLYQYEEGFKFSLDSILLAEFAEIRKKDNNIIDLCTGNGVIPTILNYKYQKKIIGIEKQEEIYNLAKLSAEKNNMKEKIELICDDVNNVFNYFSKESFDVVLCNPPYFPYHNLKYVNDNEFKKIARHEIYVNLKGIIKIAGELLREKGRFYLVHLPERIEEIAVYAHENQLAIKELQFIYAKDDRLATIVLVTLMKKGKFGTKVYPPIDISKAKTYQNLFKRGD